MPLESQLASIWPPEVWRNARVVVAVSGGPDSVALLRGLLAVRGGADGRLIAAHFNHCLRLPQADTDEAFVRSLCEQLGVSCEIGRANGLVDRGDGLEAAARDARYEFLRDTAERLAARYVVTGHTADDQAETILHRIVRGTGLAGLAGIPFVRPLTPDIALLRPMLTFRRAEVLDYLTAIGQSYCVDESNSDPGFTRNRIRAGLLPQLEQEFNPRVVDALLRLGELARETQSFVDRQVDRLADRAIERHGDSCRLSRRELQDVDPLLIRALLVRVWKEFNWPRQEMGFERWNELAEMLRTGCGQKTLPGGVLAAATEAGLELLVGGKGPQRIKGDNE